MREAQRAFGFRSEHQVQAMLDRLEERGWISRVKHRRGRQLLRPVPPPAKPLSREEGRAFARAWHVRMKPVFDAMDAAGMFLDSPARLGRAER